MLQDVDVELVRLMKTAAEAAVLFEWIADV
jgi:hypothetical protein